MVTLRFGLQRELQFKGLVKWVGLELIKAVGHCFQVWINYSFYLLFINVFVL